MSISSALRAETKDYLYIPCTTRLIHTRISKKDSALCYLISVGYLDIETYEDMKSYLEAAASEHELILPYGPCERVRIGRHIHYRQRVKFSDLLQVCEFCKRQGIHIALSEDFEVTIDSLTNCGADLRTLRVYAQQNGQNLDTYLTETCKIHFYTMLQSKHIEVENERDYLRILKGKQGYLERAPFLLSKYNRENTTSAIFIPNMALPKTMYDHSKPNITLNYGYTKKMVAKDRKAGVVA